MTMPPKKDDKKGAAEAPPPDDGAERELVEKELVIGYLKSKLGRCVFDGAFDEEDVGFGMSRGH